jgi:hypothetical protein
MAPFFSVETSVDAGDELQNFRADFSRRQSGGSIAGSMPREEAALVN